MNTPNKIEFLERLTASVNSGDLELLEIKREIDEVVDLYESVKTGWQCTRPGDNVTITIKLRRKYK